MPKKSLRGKYNCRLKGRTNNVWFTTLHYITWYKMSIAKLIVYMAPCWLGRALSCAQRVRVKKYHKSTATLCARGVRFYLEARFELPQFSRPSG